MKRSSFKRYTPLRASKCLTRSKPMKRRRAKRIDRETPAEKIHKKYVRRMTWCAAANRCLGDCDGPLQAAHLDHSRGMGLPHGTQEDTAMLCRHHHDQFDGRAKGFLRDLGEAKWGWAQVWIREAREFVAHVLAAEGAPF